MSDPTETAPLPEHHRHAGETPPPNRWKIVAIILAILVGIAVVAGVTWAIVSANNTPPAPTPTPTPTESPSPTPTPTPVTLPSCTSENTVASLGTPDGAAGSTMLPVIFTNDSAEACTLEGFPAVVQVSGGSAVGAPAAEDDSTAVALVTVEPGNSAMAMLTIATAANFDDCNPVDTDGFQVTTPGSPAPFTLQTTDYQACENTAVTVVKVSAFATN